jgi:nucleoside-diphosphate-sugar epimerase
MGIETPEFVEEFLTKDTHSFDYIYNLACPTGVPNIEYLGEEMIDTCSTGTKNVLKLAQKNKAKFLFTSSSEVYGDPEVFPQAENYTGNVDPQGVRANYEEGKRFSESLVALFVRKYAVNAKTVRLFNVYGPYMSLKDQRVIPRFVQQALRNEPLTLHNNVALRTMCYVDDIVRGLQIVIEKGEPGAIFNLGSDQEVTMKELAEKVINATESESPISYVPGHTHDHKRRMPDLSRVRALGWNYEIPLNEGLILTIENFKNRLEKDLVK